MVKNALWFFGGVLLCLSLVACWDYYRDCEGCHPDVSADGELIPIPLDRLSRIRQQQPDGPLRADLFAMMNQDTLTEGDVQTILRSMRDESQARSLRKIAAAVASEARASDEQRERLNRALEDFR